jgi:hypothetical protein
MPVCSQNIHAPSEYTKIRYMTVAGMPSATHPGSWAAAHAMVIANNGYPQHMTTPGPDLREDTTAMLAAAGITVTPEGKARARTVLAEADARRTPQRRAALRARLGLPPAPKA